jgi:hypothetical protein
LTVSTLATNAKFDADDERKSTSVFGTILSSEGPCEVVEDALDCDLFALNSLCYACAADGASIGLQLGYSV